MLQRNVRVGLILVLVAGLTAFVRASQQQPRMNPNSGFLGVKVGPIDDDAASRLKLESHNGVLVMETIPDSPAEKGGLKEDDVILKAGEHDVADVQAFMKAMSETKPDQAVNFSIIRDGKKTEVSVMLGKRPANMQQPRRDDDDKDKSEPPTTQPGK